MREPTEFRDWARKMVGLSVAKAWAGHGTAVFLEIGALRPHEARNGRVVGERGEFSLMLEWGWRVEGRTAVKFGCWSSESEIASGLAKLVGNAVGAVHVEGRLPEIVLAVGELYVRSFMPVKGQPSWTLFLPNGEWFCVKRGVVIREAPAPN